MGFFDKLLGKKQQEKVTEEVFVSPIDGKVVDITEVPDPTFSQKMMGEGIAIVPDNGKVVAPIGGEVIQLFHTKHALGIRTNGGLEVLIHIGLETVGMNGEGFTANVTEGDKVNPGDLLIEFDMELVKEKAANTITPIVLTNGEKVGSVEKRLNEKVVAGQTEVMTVHLK